MPETYFIADSHLCPGDKPEQNSDLENLFISMEGDSRVVLLGDTFNCWFERGERIVGDYEKVLTIFGKAKARGISLHHVSGNRDFVIGKPLPEMESDYTGFYSGDTRPSNLALHGIIPHGEFFSFEENGKHINCCHGDNLCVFDRYYQFFRWCMQGPIGRTVAKILPFCISAKIVGWVQRKDVLPHYGMIPFAKNISAEHASKLKLPEDSIIVCGHVHRHQEINAQSGIKIVTLPSWAETREYGKLQDNNIILVKQITSAST